MRSRQGNGVQAQKKAGHICRQPIPYRFGERGVVFRQQLVAQKNRVAGKSLVCIDQANIGHRNRRVFTHQLQQTDLPAQTRFCGSVARKLEHKALIDDQCITVPAAAERPER